jgi:hypothetical protein
MKQGRGWRALQLEEVDSLPWADTELEWRPLREALGARMVGMAAFSAGRAEQDLGQSDRGGPAQRSTALARHSDRRGAGDTALATRKLGEVLREEPGLRTALSQDRDLAPLLNGPD